jgi:hypothetical protein
MTQKHYTMFEQLKNILASDEADVAADKANGRVAAAWKLDRIARSKKTLEMIAKRDATQASNS